MTNLSEEERKDIKFFIGGSRDSYSQLSNIFANNTNVFEFTREVEEDGKISSCGHYPSNDPNQDFFNCRKRNVKGPISDSDGAVDICREFQITVLAANYGGNKTAVYKSSLVLKVTPKDLPSPSFLIMGAFENDKEDIRSKLKDALGTPLGNYYVYIKGAHAYYTGTTQNISVALASGLKSNVLLIPKHGADIYGNDDPLFFSGYVQPEYAIVSSDISSTRGYPRCSVLKNLHTSPNFTEDSWNRWTKIYQCHTERNSSIDDINRIDGDTYFYQTTLIEPTDFPNGKLQFSLISFTMTAEDVITPTAEKIFEEDLLDKQQ